MICPKCRSRAIGRIGQNQYYCWDCNIEFVPTKDGFRTYRLEPDGTTVLDSLEANPQAVMMAGGRESPVGATLGMRQSQGTDQGMELKEPIQDRAQ